MAEGTLNVCLWCCWLFGDFDTKNHKPTCYKGYMLYQLLKLKLLSTQQNLYHLFGDLKPLKKMSLLLLPSLRLNFFEAI